MRIKVHEATNLQLNWLVAQCLGHTPGSYLNSAVVVKDVRGKPTGIQVPGIRDYVWFAPTTSPAQGLPIIEREGMHLDGPSRSVGDKTWYATHPDSMTIGSGPTILVAGMRCYVASRMGLEVEIPEDLG